MNYKKLISNLDKLEKSILKLNKKLIKLSIFKSELNHYLNDDKNEVLIIWQEYIKIFDELDNLVNKLKVRNKMLNYNYDNLVLKRYVLIIYFNLLIFLLVTFGKHEYFIRQLLKDNFKKHYGFYALHFYKPKKLYYLNISPTFLKPLRQYINPDFHKYVFEEKVKISNKNRLLTDSHNVNYYFRGKVNSFLYKIVKRVGLFIAGIRFTKRKKGLITDKTLKKYLSVAEPGDILLTRGNWNATNISIPGFWKHMGMYLGTGKYLEENFEVKNLKSRTHYIIEATGEGVNIKPISDMLYKTDYLGVFRTKFSDNKIKKVIKCSLGYLGSSYDFLFDFYSDKSFVCSELIMKSYSKDSDSDEGILVDLEKVGNGLIFPPNNFVKKVNLDLNAGFSHIKPVFFIDTIERKQKNFVSTPKRLLGTYTRPRLTLFLK